MRDSMDTVAIGRRIRDLRKEKDLTMGVLARAVGVSVQAVSYWETGQNCISLANAVKVAEKLDTTLDYLAGKQEEK